MAPGTKTEEGIETSRQYRHGDVPSDEASIHER